MFHDICHACVLCIGCIMSIQCYVKIDSSISINLSIFWCNVIYLKPGAGFFYTIQYNIFQSRYLSFGFH